MSRVIGSMEWRKNTKILLYNKFSSRSPSTFLSSSCEFTFLILVRCMCSVLVCFSVDFLEHLRVLHALLSCQFASELFFLCVAFWKATKKMFAQRPCPKNWNSAEFLLHCCLVLAFTSLAHFTHFNVMHSTKVRWWWWWWYGSKALADK